MTKQLEHDHHLLSRAKALIADQRTLVLSTSVNDSPWTAPVYYVYAAPGFFFFSSPRSRHTTHALQNKSAAAAIFKDSAKWEQIEGLQMSGNLEEVTGKIKTAKITGRFLLKFPFARSFLGDASDEIQTGFNIRNRVCLYAFLPDQVYFTSNRLGFGQRFAVSLDHSFSNP
jgi:uncharacterized protein